MANKKLEAIAQQAIQQAHDEGMDDEDAAWMATGALVNEARKQGVIGSETSKEVTAAAKNLVENIIKKQ